MSEAFWSRFFWLAGLWNVAAALALASVPATACDLLFRDESVDPLVLFLIQLFALAVAAFGVGYARVGFDVHKNRAVVQIGGACKLILFPMALHAYFNGFGTGLLVALITGDVIWAGFFGVFLLQNRP
jgi:hypothetical protein